MADNRSGGIDAHEDKIDIGRDAVGRDKIESSTTYNYYYGAGGIGKTALAIEVAHRARGAIAG